MSNYFKYYVATQCFTYNQASSIKETLQGFVIQKTSFPVVYIIMDDASSDGEQEVLLEWANENLDFESQCDSYKKNNDRGKVIYACHKSNKNAFFAIVLFSTNLFRNPELKMDVIGEWVNSSKYIAYCEGDDYWTHPQKLQMQVDALDNNPTSSLCFHAHKNYFPDGKVQNFIPYKSDIIITPEEVISMGDGVVVTASILCKKRSSTLPSFWKNCPVGDIPLRLYYASEGSFVYINEMMSVYRLQMPGSWSAKNRSMNEWFSHQKRIINTYREFNDYTSGLYSHTIHKRIIKLYYEMYRDYVKSLIKMVIPGSMIDLIRKK